MRFIKTLILIALVVSCADLFAASQEEMADKELGEIQGSKVYIRSGAGLNFYRCAIISEPAKVVIAGEEMGWSKIYPPEGLFSWVSRNYVDVSDIDPSKGIINRDNTRVWTGSEFVPAIHCSTNQVNLNKGDEVKFYDDNSAEDDYYKIVPPEGAFVWVNSAYIKNLGPLSQYTPQTAEPKPAEKPAQPKEQAEDEAETEMKDTETAEEPAGEEQDSRKDNGEAEPLEDAETSDAQVEAEKPAQDTQPAPKVEIKETETAKMIKKCLEIGKQLDRELSKEQVDLSILPTMKEELTTIVNHPESGKAGKYAGYLLNKINSVELARTAMKQVEQQDKELAEKRARIRANLDDKLSKVDLIANHTLSGKFYQSAVYPERWLIKDRNNKVIAYGIPAKKEMIPELKQFIGRDVALAGDARPDAHNSLPLITFTKITPLED
ncbi:SH3 domain protein [Limihaloglobus sulfuriphilus]|uniref:SH3 domain protein n=1 Tax=Limihaloglobus sulfuriphilus TaxID=1851148 RepID=A0A1Q2MIV1_9BACT|nr:hypothetical protein [Limihaloglobus sulfuriphilus]AQQ72192.1 SH3 domain protein [Limihaloglobus sulfuriphilus]